MSAPHAAKHAETPQSKADSVAEHARDGQHSNKSLAHEIHEDLKGMTVAQRQAFYQELRKDGGGGSKSGDVHLPHIKLHDGANGGEITVYKGKGHQKETIEAKTGTKPGPGGENVHRSPDGKHVTGVDRTETHDGKTTTTHYAGDGHTPLGSTETETKDGKTVTTELGPHGEKKSVTTEDPKTGTKDTDYYTNGKPNGKHDHTEKVGDTEVTTHSQNGKETGTTTAVHNKDGTIDSTNRNADGKITSTSHEDPEKGTKETKNYDPKTGEYTGKDEQQRLPDGSVVTHSYDAAGQLTTVATKKTNADGTTETHSINAQTGDSTTTVQNPDGSVKSRTIFDAKSGDTTKTTFGKNGAFDRTVTDATGKVTSEIHQDENGNWHSTDHEKNGDTKDTSYNKATGQTTTTVTHPDGTYASIVQDKNGNTLSETTKTKNGEVSTITYDANTHQPTGKSSYGANDNPPKITRSTWDPNTNQWVVQTQQQDVPSP